MSLDNMPMDGDTLAVPGLADASAASRAGERALAGLDDRILIERSQAGDRTAFEALIHRYDRDVLRLALNILHSSEDARDVYQEAFLKIYRNIHRFRFECAFYTWIYRIVSNVCLDHMRRRRCRPEDQAPEVTFASHRDEGPAGDFFDRQQEVRAEADPERTLLGHEIGARIESAMAALSPRERMVFEMKHYQGLKLRAIGDALGTTEETVINSLFRATRKLRLQLEGIR
jgi:RNA polymerase sigma-70 factor (ECF subfamily)